MGFLEKMFNGFVLSVIFYPIILIALILIVGYMILQAKKDKAWIFYSEMCIWCLLLAILIGDFSVFLTPMNEITFIDNSNNYTVSESYKCKINYENMNLICIDDKNKIVDISSSKKIVQPIEVKVISKNKKSADVPYYSITYRDSKISKDSDIIIAVSKEKYYQTEKLLTCKTPANLGYINMKICLD